MFVTYYFSAVYFAITSELVVLMLSLTQFHPVILLVA